ncbi:sortase [Chloroflexota bacterium]
MRDKRSVDELSIEELEQILAIRKRERRQKQLRRMSKEGRRVIPPATTTPPPVNQTIEPEQAASSSTGTTGSGFAPIENPAQAPPAFIPSDESELHGELRFEEEPTTPPAPQEASPFLKMVWNRTLLLVEILAMLGLVIIGFQLVRALQTLRVETAAVQAEAQAAAYANIPTPTPTPEISLNQVVLPSGHTPPSSSGGAQFNLNEIPEHLRPIVQQQLAAPIVIPTPGPESPVRIIIPALGIDAPVVSGTDWESLKRGVGHQQSTGMPGRAGNVVLSAHNDIYGELFRHLDQLSPGDEIQIYTLTQTYTYTVRDSQIVSPYAVQVMSQTQNPTTTLISCYPYQVDNQRYVVFADLERN